MQSNSNNIGATIGGIAASVAGAVVGGIVLSIAYGILTGQPTIGWLFCGLFVGLVLAASPLRRWVYLKVLSARQPAPQVQQSYKRTLISDIIWSSVTVLLFFIVLLQIVMGWSAIFSGVLLGPTVIAAVIAGCFLGTGSWLFVTFFGPSSHAAIRRA